MASVAPQVHTDLDGLGHQGPRRFWNDFFDELAQAIERAVVGFSSITGIDEELANRLVEEGFLSYDDLSIIEPDALMAMGSLSEDEANVIVEQAEARAEVAGGDGRQPRRRGRPAPAGIAAV